MKDAVYEWNAQVEASKDDAESLSRDIDLFNDALADVVHALDNLRHVTFDEDVEDYVIYERARQLWDTTQNATRDIRLKIGVAREGVQDLHRIVGFYQNGR
ncbi:hypothetical protein [Rhodococcus sp. IEGM 1374]|uniref:hypothetical protein n=1 Tax=Rhodococcus sp. IEGM 1374 TaxID=3082221 RepID=UPI002952E7AB|nr:hypothetical protein [Rhodococcus sp. IEGM 1374]MDV7990493.1 hypothetical protein [Rhodococcus sp. IEGM 1374]